MSDEIAEGFAERMHNQCSAALSQLFAATIRCGTPHEDGLDPTNHLLHNASLVMTAAGAPRTSRPFRLMDLPGELRTHIHELAFARAPGEVVPLRDKLPGITQPSRQLRQETLELYLSMTSFRIAPDDSENDYGTSLVRLNNLGHSHARLMRRIRIEIRPPKLPEVDIWRWFRPYNVDDYEKLIVQWRDFIHALKDAGVQAERLPWTLGDLSVRHITRAGFISAAQAAQIAALHELIIKPVLRRAEFFPLIGFANVADRVRTHAKAGSVVAFDRRLMEQMPKIEEALAHLDWKQD